MFQYVGNKKYNNKRDWEIILWGNCECKFHEYAREYNMIEKIIAKLIFWGQGTQIGSKFCYADTKYDNERNGEIDI